MPGVSSSQIRAIASTISEARLQRYIDARYKNRRLALELYRWNSEVSAALMSPMAVCEVALRNGIIGAVEAVYGAKWFVMGSAFERSLPNPATGYSARRDLADARKAYTSSGKVIPELKFMFWVMMMTKRHDVRLWNPHLRNVFPGLPPHFTVPEARLLLHQQLDEIRVLRNRIAHHEPVFERHMTSEYRRILRVLEWLSPNTAHWLDSWQSVTNLIARQP